MKRKINYFEKKIKEIKDTFQQYDDSNLEKFLLSEICLGNDQEKGSKKSRKRNYSFFENNIL